MAPAPAPSSPDLASSVSQPASTPPEAPAVSREWIDAGDRERFWQNVHDACCTLLLVGVLSWPVSPLHRFLLALVAVGAFASGRRYARLSRVRARLHPNASLAMGADRTPTPLEKTPRR